MSVEKVVQFQLFCRFFHFKKVSNEEMLKCFNNYERYLKSQLWSDPDYKLQVKIVAMIKSKRQGKLIYSDDPVWDQQERFEMPVNNIAYEISKKFR